MGKGTVETPKKARRAIKKEKKGGHSNKSVKSSKRGGEKTMAWDYQ